MSSYEKPSQTLDQVLELARLVWARRVNGNTREARLAKGILDLLGEAQPCGMEPPDVGEFTDGGKWLRLFDDTAPVAIGEARAFCAMVLRSCDEADRGEAG